MCAYDDGEHGREYVCMCIHAYVCEREWNILLVFVYLLISVYLHILAFSVFITTVFLSFVLRKQPNELAITQSKSYSSFS